MGTEDLLTRAKSLALAPFVKLSSALGSSSLGLLLPGIAFAALAIELTQRPQDLAGPIEIDFKLPSEGAIPRSEPVRPIDEQNDPIWRFRYAETGTEFRAGIPYWIFRIMPRIFQEEFHGQGYEHFGMTEDDHSYYSSRPVPRGMALSDTELRSSLLKLRFSLKRVSINCSGCHRGEYLGANGQRVLQDGMPNHTADLQGFKRFFGSAFQSPKFEAGRVISEINRALAEEGHAPLTHVEELLYRGLVAALKQFTRERSGAWMDSRPDNGPGRIDPFNAVKFEVLKAPDDHTAATLDFPSVWNQRAELRPWHHCDGNTDESRARNFGSVIGVGGIPDSVNKQSVNKVGQWFDVFPPPKYPFDPPGAEAVARGRAVFEKSCANCHGIYDPVQRSIVDRERWRLYMQIDYAVGTDPERWKAFLPNTAQALNGFGALHSLWTPTSFRGSKDPGGYLCGPLDGIWARAPYLHNGSVPNIVELLKPPAERVQVFYRGNRHYDQAQMGWVHDQPREGDRPLFEYDTSLPGNHNTGHAYGTTLDEGQRADLIAYLKTL